MSSQRAADGELTCAIHSLAALIEFLLTTGAEMSLTVLSYILKRAINILGVPKLIEAVT
jgi:hypothetical protein